MSIVYETAGREMGIEDDVAGRGERGKRGEREGISEESLMCFSSYDDNIIIPQQR